ncbi:ribokinase [Rhizosaccharibacter radicis]|uniref:Deoxyribokinase n=1 Tax=Rhizosaccharibacter radicis TaxID=2782605 RepID=A0ABT1VZS2_9PROT|nr:ribokinase [Acetobacteraceae bacterium KSS12]
MTNDRPQRIAVIGSNMVDLVTTIDRLPREGETLEAPGFSLGKGGKGANQAAAAAKLGAPVLMVSRVGDDLFGADTIRNFAELGIDHRHVRAVPGTTSGVAPIFVDAQGRNSILIVKGANDHLRPADVDEAAPDLLACDLILLQLEIPLDTVYHAIDWAHANGKRVLLNPAPATTSLSLERIRHVDFFMPNQTELHILTGLPTETPADAETAARALLERGMGTVVVTLGADGALLVTPGGCERIAPVAVRARDTTGAGDAFIGAFAAHLAEGLAVKPALEAAGRYAAHSVTRAGTQKAFATREEFTEFCMALPQTPDAE